MSEFFDLVTLVVQYLVWLFLAIALVWATLVSIKWAAKSRVYLFLVGLGFLLLSCITAPIYGSYWLDAFTLTSVNAQYAALGYGLMGGAVLATIVRLFRRPEESTESATDNGDLPPAEQQSSASDPK